MNEEKRAEKTEKEIIEQLCEFFHLKKWEKYYQHPTLHTLKIIL